ncbi:hypothetical protein Tco_1336631 [Tanacetum coccineum]
MERGFLTSASKEKDIDGGSKANSVLSGLTMKIRNIDRKIIVKDSTQRKAIRCVQADPVLDVIANAAMDKDHAEGPPLKSILKRPNVASNMAVMNAATEVLVKDLQHDVNSGPDSCNLKALPPMEGLHSDVNINIVNVDNLANSPKPVMGINVAPVLVSEVIRGSTCPGDYSATNAVKQCNSSASDVPKSTVAVTDRASKTAPMSFANIIKSQHVKKGNFRSLLNAEKVESFDFVLPKYAVDAVKSSSKVERMNEATNDNSLIECEGDIIILCRLATVAYGAASATWMARQRPDDIVLVIDFTIVGVQTTTYMSDNIPSVTGNHHIFHQPPNAPDFCGRQISTLSSLLCSLIDSDPVQEKQKSTGLLPVKEHDEARIDLRFKKMKKKMSKSQTISNANRPKSNSSAGEALTAAAAPKLLVKRIDLMLPVVISYVNAAIDTTGIGFTKRSPSCIFTLTACTLGLGPGCIFTLTAIPWEVWLIKPEYFDLWDSCMIKSLKLPKSGNQLRFLIHRVPSGRTSNALSIPRRFMTNALTRSGLIRSFRLKASATTFDFPGW